MEAGHAPVSQTSAATGGPDTPTGVRAPVVSGEPSTAAGSAFGAAGGPNSGSRTRASTRTSLRANPPEFSIVARCGIGVVAFLAKRIGGCECSTRRTELESTSPSGDDGFDNCPRRSGFRVTKMGTARSTRTRGSCKGAPGSFNDRQAPRLRAFTPRSIAAPGSLSPTSAPLTTIRRSRARALCTLGLVVAGFATSNAAGAIDFAPRLTVRTEPQPTAVLVRDVTGDRVPDIVTASSSSSQLVVHAGLGGGRFAAGTGIVISERRWRWRPAISTRTGPSTSRPRTGIAP